MDWYRWHIKLYRADTLHLTLAQDGAYRRLIDEYMERRRPLPDNDAAIARILGVAPAEWLEMASVIRPFFIHRQGQLIHKRCDAELNRQDMRSKTLSEVGSKGADARWNKNKDLNGNGKPKPSHRYAEQMQEESKRRIRGEETPLLNSNSENINSNSARAKNAPNSKIHDQDRKPTPLRGQISAKAINFVQSIAPGYDLQHIERQFEKFNHGKDIQNPDAAFIGFVKVHVAKNPLQPTAHSANDDPDDLTTIPETFDRTKPRETG